MKEICEVCKKEKEAKNIIHYCNYPVPGGTIKFIICKNCDQIIEKWDEMVTEKWEKLKKEAE